jgi:RimJ/RimL family protein N-acetyltransferase
MITIQTKNLMLRTSTSQDYQILSDLWRDAEVRRFLGGVLSEEEIAEKINYLLSHFEKYGYGIFTVIENKTQEIVGLCGLLNTENGIELVYMTFVKWWRQGLTQEAAKATIEFAFNTLKLDRIVAITQDDNINSCKMLEKLGMHQCGNIYKFEALQRIYEMLNKSIGKV